MIQNIYISDADEKYGPPEKPVLEVGMVGDIVFLSIGKAEETPDTRSYTANAHVAVPACDLMNAIKSMAASEHRYDLAKVHGDSKLRTANP